MRTEHDHQRSNSSHITNAVHIAKARDDEQKVSEIRGYAYSKTSDDGEALDVNIQDFIGYLKVY